MALRQPNQKVCPIAKYSKCELPAVEHHWKQSTGWLRQKSPPHSPCKTPAQHNEYIYVFFNVNNSIHIIGFYSLLDMYQKNNFVDAWFRFLAEDRGVSFITGGMVLSEIMASFGNFLHNTYIYIWSFWSTGMCYERRLVIWQFCTLRVFDWLHERARKTKTTFGAHCTFLIQPDPGTA